MRQGQHEILVEGVQQAEAQLVVVPPPMHRLLGDVAERVVHPAHIPLEAEAEPAHIRRPAHHRPGGRFLGDGQHARAFRVDHLVHPPQEVDGLEVLPSTVLVWHPLPLATGIVQVQHRGNRVYPQSIQVVLLQPEQRIRDQEAAHLVAAVVEDLGAPVGVPGLARIAVLVERRAVKHGQAVRIIRKVARDPIHEHADARPVQRVHEVFEVVRRAKAAGRRVVAEALIPP